MADYLDALGWVADIGGLPAMIRRSRDNLDAIRRFVDKESWIQFLAKDPETVSNTSVCLTLDATPEQVKAIVKVLDEEDVAYDIGAYRDAPPGLRIWCGATIETTDIELMLSWLRWAYGYVTSKK